MRVHLGSLTFGVVIFCGLLSACSSKSDESSSGQSHPVAQAELASALAHALCDNIGGCCTQFGFAYDAATCVSTEQATTQSRLAALDMTVYSYDPVAAGDCIAQLSQLKTCTTDQPVYSFPEPCQRMFVGTVPAGGACRYQAVSQCAATPGGRVDCSSFSSSDPGQCVFTPTPAHGKVGDACFESCFGSSPNFDCLPVSGATGSTACWSEDELLCSSTGTCISPHAIGEACPDPWCVSGSYCNSAQVCVAQAPVGAACTEVFACAQGGYCDASLTCVARLPDGAACTSDGLECLSGNCIDQKCSRAVLVDSNICAGALQPF